MKIDMKDTRLVVRGVTLHQIRETVSECHKGLNETSLGNQKNINEYLSLSWRQDVVN